MNAVFLIALVTVATLASTQALSCFGCDSEDLRCTPLHLQNCKGGLTTDACGCCAVCAKVVGETCGGPWNVKGKCDCGLTCYKSEEVKQQMGEFNEFRWLLLHNIHFFMNWLFSEHINTEIFEIALYRIVGRISPRNLALL